MARVAAPPLGIAIGLTVSACFIKPDAPGGTTEQDASVSGDVLMPMDGMTACPVRDDFTGTNLPLCGDWGVREGSALAGGNQNFYRSGSGRLVMSSSGSGGSGACQSSIDLPFTAVAVQILEAPTIQGARTGLQLTLGDGNTFAIEVQGTGGAVKLVAFDDGSEIAVGGFDITMTDFRLVKNGASNIALRVSNASGTSSITNNFFTLSALETARVRLYTSFGSNTSFALSEFDNLDGCAP